MADLAMGSVEKIVSLALAIKEAVDMVRQNGEECREIQKVVARVSAILSQLEETKMLKGPAMKGALMDLEETLHRALKLVTECQERHIVRHFFTAGDMSKELRRVQDDISQKMMLGLFAINVQATIILSNIQYAGVPRPPQPQDTDVVETSQSGNSINDDARARLNVKKTNLLEGSEVPPPPLPAADLRKFTLSELRAATHNFAEENIVGKGSCCTVYKGVLHGGLVVAIKKLHSDRYAYELMNFIYHGPKLQHKNVVKCMGYGVEQRMKWVRWFKNIPDEERLPIWVEEYMPNGSLEEIVNGPQLDWSSRFRIIQGIAQALHYLHEQHVVHMDVKPGNILFDSDMNPKINDFGVAKVLHGMDEDETNTVVGTMKYIDPNYVMTARFSAKCDVYSFGITLLETVRGMCESKLPPNETHPLELAFAGLQDRGVEELFGPSLVEESQREEIRRCTKIGLLCGQAKPEDRPSMQDVLEMLNGEKEIPIPKEPRPYKWI